MTEAVVEKATCENCGVDVREGTAFCYNCGVPVKAAGEEIEASSQPVRSLPDEQLDAEPEMDPKAREALDDLAEKLKFDEEADKKLAKAAAERRRARVSQRKTSKEFAWQGEEGVPGLLLLATAVIALFAIVIVLFTVFWK